MFDQEWAFKDGDTLTVQSLPYFYNDPKTGQTYEMSNCDDEVRKSLGWYQIVFDTVHGSRISRYFESLGDIKYDSNTDTVICTSFNLVANWRESIIDDITNTVISLINYEQNKSLYDDLLLKVNKYFKNEKYDAYQLDKYATIIKNFLFDLASLRITYIESVDGIHVPQLRGEDGKLEWQPEDVILKYIKNNLKLFKDKKVLCVGLTSCTEASLLAANGIKVSVLDNVFYEFGQGEFHIAFNSVLSAMVNDVYFDILEEENYDFSKDDILIFQGSFFLPKANDNLQMILDARKMGKKIIINSPNVWNGKRPDINLPQTKLKALFKEDNKVVFTLK